MGIWRSMAGLVRAEITSADSTGLLQKINQENIELYDIDTSGDLTVQISIHRRDLPAVKRLSDKQGAELKVQKQLGVFWRGKALLRRPVLLIGLLILLLAAIYLPSRIFFVKVEGNAQLPTKLILEKAAECGISFGTSRRAVRSEKVKNALLSAIPELQWAGVNTSGCVATVCVREKTVTDIQEDTPKKVSSIVAARDGIIVSCTVLNGNSLCQVGQAVKAGQTLVSGYTDCGITIQATQAEAEILAQTYRTVELITPLTAEKRGDSTHTETKYSLLLGKKLINFYKDSRISDATCVKMYEEEYLTLPGGFQLPVALITERWVYYEMETVTCQRTDDFSWMEEASSSYLRSQMVAGQILKDQTSQELLGDVCSLQGKYFCLEMIGQVKNEEILYDYGEKYGEDR